MRIIGDIDHPRMKITIMQHDGKLLLKFEKDLLEQTYKFRAGESLETASALKALIGDSFMGKVENMFHEMLKEKMELQHSSGAQEGFEDII